MRRQLGALLLAAVLVTVGLFFSATALASPVEEYTGTHFGDKNVAPGCEHDTLKDLTGNSCYHMRTGLNGLDSPQVDVLIMVPASPTATRDVRIMRQAVEMWEGGIHNLAPQMGLKWLGKGMQFHITVDVVGFDGNGGEFTTYPIVDPEIVVIAANPVGLIGIGIDPVATAGSLTGDPGDVPCAGVRNPFDFAAWDALPGFETHHEERVGTYVEDCGGAGGNICFAVNTAQDIAPESFDPFNLFDLVAHEFGHCLTLGHVGDGAEGPWARVPTNDIMAYNNDPVGGNKCVSTLDVEGIAVRMSRYLDVNNDKKVSAADRLLANDQAGDKMNAFQTQHPRDHWYASGTGDPLDCPQPDLKLLARKRTNWEPDPVSTNRPVLKVAPLDQPARDGSFVVSGTVEHVSNSRPKKPTAYYDDSDTDATSDATEITALDVAVKPSTLEVAIRLEELPAPAMVNVTSYSVLVNGRRFDSFVPLRPVESGPVTWDAERRVFMPSSTSTWDPSAKTVTFRIPRDYLAADSVHAPYKVSAHSSFGTGAALVPDDQAPDDRRTVGVSTARVKPPAPRLLANAGGETVTFHHPEGNTFQMTDSTLNLGLYLLLGSNPTHRFELNVPQTSDVAFKLDWTDDVGGTDLDLRVSGAATSNDGSGASRPEQATLRKVRGKLSIEVEPFLVTDPVNGTTYTLTAVVTPTSSAPETPAVAVTKPAPERVNLYIDGKLFETQAVDTSAGPGSFGILAKVARGKHELRVEWEAFGGTLETETLYIQRR